MVFAYQPVDQSGRLAQGEILFGAWEPLPANADGQLAPDNATISFTVVRHDKIVVVTPDCDLFSDFFYRFNQDVTAENEREARTRQSHLLSHILCCEVYDQKELKSSIAPGSDIWSRVERNQDERYQHIQGGPSAD